MLVCSYLLLVPLGVNGEEGVCGGLEWVRISDSKCYVPWEVASYVAGKDID